MRLLDRYLLRELMVPLAYCLGGFLVLWMSFDLFAELSTLQEHKLKGFEIAQYCLLKTPEFLVFVLPIALLLALLYTLTNHARWNEITAIRAAGVSLWRLCVPYFGVGLLATAALFVTNEFWAPYSSDSAEDIMNRHVQGKKAAARTEVRNSGFTNAREHRVWQWSAYNLDTALMNGVQVLWSRPDNTRLWLQAERAMPTNGGWNFINVREHVEAAQPGALPLPVLQTNALFMPFSETPEEIASDLRISGSIGLRAIKKADLPLNHIYNYLRLHPNPSRSDRAWLYTKFYGRLAAPWTCLVVILIAIPFGAASGRRNRFVGVASSILICFSYFVLQQLGMALGTGSYVPPWLAAWAPNIAFGLTGLILTARVR